jgi:hypothetical protein
VASGKNPLKPLAHKKYCMIVKKSKEFRFLRNG